MLHHAHLIFQHSDEQEAGRAIFWTTYDQTHMESSSGPDTLVDHWVLFPGARVARTSNDDPKLR
eukprot:6061341-Amphidinium_carterae.1